MEEHRDQQGVSFGARQAPVSEVLFHHIHIVTTGARHFSEARFPYKQKRMGVLSPKNLRGVVKVQSYVVYRTQANEILIDIILWPPDRHGDTRVGKYPMRQVRQG